MTKQLTPLRRKDQATGYQAAVRDIVAWLRSNCMSSKWRILASEIEERFGEKK